MSTETEVLEEVKGVLDEKDDDYGSSYEKAGVLKRVLADEDGPSVYTVNGGKLDDDKYMHGELVEVVVLADTPQNETVFEENADGLITRLLDKLSRTYTLIFLKDEPDVENESTEDAAKDMVGYSSMLTSLIRRA